MRGTLPAVITVLAVAGLACGGTLKTEERGENVPDEDVWLTGVPGPDDDPDDDYCGYTGPIASEDDRGRVWVMLTEVSVDCEKIETDDHSTSKVLFSAVPEDVEATATLNMTGLFSPGLMFTSAGPLVSGEIDPDSVFTLLDPDDLSIRMSRETPARYDALSTSPSGRFVAGYDGDTDYFWFIHPESLTSANSRIGNEDADEASSRTHAGVWFQRSDRFVITSSRTTPATDSTETPDGFDHTTRLVLWTLEDAGSPSAAEREVDRTLEHVYARALAVSPDDAVVAWIGQTPTDATPRLTVWYPDSDETVDVVAADGPIAFTPDATTLVTLRNDGGGTSLVLVDTVSLEVVTSDLPVEGGTVAFVTHEGNLVVVANVEGEAPLLLYDLETGEIVEVGDTDVAISLFASRLGHDELWIVDHGLWCLDLVTGTLEAVPLDWMPVHIAWMPGADILVLDDALARRLVYVDPDTREVVGDVALPEAAWKDWDDAVPTGLRSAEGEH